MGLSVSLFEPAEMVCNRTLYNWVWTDLRTIWVFKLLLQFAKSSYSLLHILGVI